MMNIKNVLLATKRTALEYYRQKHDDPKGVLPSELLAKKKLEHEEHYNSFNNIKKILDKYHVSYQRIYMPYGAYEEYAGRDLVISIGGDGTVLNAAHYIHDKTPLLTVKSEGNSVGALCKIVASQFESTLIKLLDDKYSLESWTRVEGKFGSKSDIALNEIVVARKDFKTASYSMIFNEQCEEQRSSKILISTGAGSSGWYVNAGNMNQKFHPTSRELRFTVSESPVDRDYRMLHGHLYQGDTLEITSLMDFDGCILFDGGDDNNKRIYDFPIGKKLCVKISDKPLSVVIPII